MLTINSWAASLIRCAAGIIDWTDEKMNALDRKQQGCQRPGHGNPVFVTLLGKDLALSCYMITAECKMLAEKCYKDKRLDCYCYNSHTTQLRTGTGVFSCQRGFSIPQSKAATDIADFRELVRKGNYYYYYYYY